MSKTSARARLVQLKEWLESRKSATPSKGSSTKFSKADHYNKTR